MEDMVFSKFILSLVIVNSLPLIETSEAYGLKLYKLLIDEQYAPAVSIATISPSLGLDNSIFSFITSVDSHILPTILTTSFASSSLDILII